MRIKLSIGIKTGIIFLVFLLEILSFLFAYNIVGRRYEFYVNRHEEEMIEFKLVNQLQAVLSQMVLPVNDFYITGEAQNEKRNFELLSDKFGSLIAILDLWDFSIAEGTITLNQTKENYLRFKELAADMFVIPRPAGNPEAARLMKNMNNLARETISILMKFQDTAKREFTKTNAGKKRINNQLDSIVLLGVLFNVALIIYAIIYFRITISHPLIRLKNAALEVGKGNLDNKVDVKLNDEIGELCVVFNNMTDSLKDAQLQLMQAEKMELVGKLARGVAHEVRNPLAIIVQGIDYLSQIASGKDESCAFVLDGMSEAVKKADLSINDLLEFASTRKLDVKPLDVNVIIEKSLALVKYQLEKSNIEVVTELKKDIPSILGDNNKIEQAFINFFTNAIESMAGGGQIKVRTYAKESTGVIEDASRKKEKSFKFVEKTVVAEIEDSGSGIPQDSLDKIFTPYFTTKGENGGAGLGLWIVRNIVEMHGGSLKIENKTDSKGAKVTVVFKA